MKLRPNHFAPEIRLVLLSDHALNEVARRLIFAEIHVTCHIIGMFKKAEPLVLMAEDRGSA